MTQPDPGLPPDEQVVRQPDPLLLRKLMDLLDSETGSYSILFHEGGVDGAPLQFPFIRAGNGRSSPKGGVRFDIGDPLPRPDLAFLYQARHSMPPLTGAGPLTEADWFGPITPPDPAPETGFNQALYEQLLHFV